MRHKRATLGGQRKPSWWMLRRARKIGRAIIHAVDDRSAIVAAQKLDPAFSLPDANWHESAINDYLNGYRLLASLDWNEIQYLRLRTQMFPGSLNLGHNYGVRCADPIPPDFDDCVPNEPDERLVSRWNALTDGLPARFVYRPVHMLGELGCWHKGVILNEDTVAYQERLSLLYRSGVFAHLPKRPRVLEIGGGYGALASAMLSAFPGCEYWICDLPESLLYSGLYLSLTRADAVRVQSGDLRPATGVNLMPNYFFSRLDADRRGFDLVINTLSLSEMSAHQIECYASGVSQLIGHDGLFFEQNQDNRSVGLEDCKVTVAKHFAERRPISLNEGLIHGGADVWSNRNSIG